MSHCLAQTGTTSVRALVVDKTGAAIADAKVMISNEDQGLQRETQTDNSGQYHFLARRENGAESGGDEPRYKSRYFELVPNH
jgi:hypothetical protein